MDARDDSGYKKWRFDASREPSRSTLWRRKKFKRKLETLNDEELSEYEISERQPDLQDRVALGESTSSYHVRQTMDSEVREVMQAAQNDDNFSSCDAHPCLGKRHLLQYNHMSPYTLYVDLGFLILINIRTLALFHHYMHADRGQSK